YSGDGSSARRARKRSSGESPGDGQALRSSGRQSTARVKRSNNPPPGQVQCTKPDCRKWRQLTKEIQLTASLAATYRCGLKVNNIKGFACSGNKSCPISTEGRRGSPCDLSMAELRTDPCRAVQPQSLCPYFQPFYQPNECGKALCVRPDMMELDELYEFPEFSRDPTMYLALRNLILASWHKNCQVNTRQQCRSAFKIHHLVGAHCMFSLQKKVIIIGAGASGLAAARQLQNFGTQVVVLEARDRIGGRVWDDTSLGVTVGRGAQIVNGCVNNPIALMVLIMTLLQMGIRMHKLGERCDLFQEGGWVTDPAIDKRMDFHFNAILDVVSDWRNDKSQKQDTPLGGAVHFP
ncbi:hypothetical protein GOODEAATRI_027827, partial [Goodea atripinnis]